MLRLVPAKIAARPLDGVTFLAWVAYPAESDQKRRVRFVRACAAGIHKANMTGRHAPNELRGWDGKNILNTINRGLDRINKRRLLAVWMALHQLNVSEDDAYNGWGLKEAARMLLDSKGAADPASGPIVPESYSAYHNDDPFNVPNVRRLIWCESLPALAMTMALPLSLAQPADSRSIISLITETDWSDGSIDTAKQLAPIIQVSFSADRILIPVK